MAQRQTVREYANVDEVRTAEHSRSGLERPFQVTLSLFAKNVNGDWLGFKYVFETHETLNKQGLGVFHVAVEESHHANTHEDTPDLGRIVRLDTTCELAIITHELGYFAQIIVFNGGRD